MLHSVLAVVLLNATTQVISHHSVLKTLQKITEMLQYKKRTQFQKWNVMPLKVIVIFVGVAFFIGHEYIFGIHLKKINILYLCYHYLPSKHIQVQLCVIGRSEGEKKMGYDTRGPATRYTRTL